MERVRTWDEYGWRYTSAVELMSKKGMYGEKPVRVLFFFFFYEQFITLSYSPNKSTRWIGNESNGSFNEFHSFLILSSRMLTVVKKANFK